MNILIINYEFPPLGGGGGVFSRDLAVEFAKKHNVDVLTSHFRGLEKKETVDGITIHRVPVLGRTSLYYATMPSLLSFPLSGIIKGLDLLREKKYDIINTHFAVPTGPVGMILSRFSGVPNVLSVHGSDIYNPVKKTSPHKHAMLRWAVRTALRAAAKVVAQSTDTKYHTEKFYGPLENITIIPLGIPAPTFAPIDRGKLSMQKNKVYLISIGRLVKRKGYDHLIGALGLLRKQGLNPELLLVGDGPEHSPLEKLSKELGLSDRVLFLDSVDDEKKFQYLSAADMYVLSSIHEGFGIVLLEAMYCGLPIVATNRGGQTDIIEDGKNGLLVPPADAESLANAVRTLMEDADRRHAISAYNREYVKPYGISAVAERYLKVFTEVLANR